MKHMSNHHDNARSTFQHGYTLSWLPSLSAFLAICDARLVAATASITYRNHRMSPHNRDCLCVLYMCVRMSVLCTCVDVCPRPTDTSDTTLTSSPSSAVASASQLVSLCVGVSEGGGSCVGVGGWAQSR